MSILPPAEMHEFSSANSWDKKSQNKQELEKMEVGEFSPSNMENARHFLC